MVAEAEVAAVDHVVASDHAEFAEEVVAAQVSVADSAVQTVVVASLEAVVASEEAVEKADQAGVAEAVEASEANQMARAARKKEKPK
jgi:hypothetical protein